MPSSLPSSLLSILLSQIVFLLQIIVISPEYGITKSEKVKEENAITLPKIKVILNKKKMPSTLNNSNKNKYNKNNHKNKIKNKQNKTKTKNTQLQFPHTLKKIKQSKRK